jgi:hypothetical protein
MTEWLSSRDIAIIVNREKSVVDKARRKGKFKSYQEDGRFFIDKQEAIDYFIMVDNAGTKKYISNTKTKDNFSGVEEVNESFDKVEDDDFLGDIHSRKAIKMPLPPKGECKYYLITASQNNTKINTEFFKNLLAVKEHFNAELLVSRLVYNKNSLNTAREKDSVIDENNNEPRYASCLNAYLNDDYLELSNDLVYLGYSNRSITAQNPLASSHHYGWEKSFILPHTKRALESYPLTYAKSCTNNKIGYTTGVCTTQNYIQNTAGQKMEMFHYYGACLVKVLDDGSSFVYQLPASEDGNFSIAFLDLLFVGGKVLKNQIISGIVLGDTHHGKLHKTTVFEDFFGKNNMFKGLNIDNVVVHDSLDFSSGSHHSMKNYLKKYVEHHTKESDVFKELKITVKKIAKKCHVVSSNHDNHLGQFLNNAIKPDDYDNALTTLLLNTIQYANVTVNNNINTTLTENCIYPPFRQILQDVKGFKGDIYEFVSRKMIGLSDGIEFINHMEDVFIQDYLINLHGDKGTNGSRSVKSSKNISQKMIVGHSHTPSIQDFLTIVGYTGEKSKFDYAASPSSWAIAFSLIYTNGTSGLYFYQNGNFR